ncbi:MAG TPA: YqaJ viral recombinase family protein [Verrucomicrobiae bacterium]|jgi:putative phage-type endonuclease
MNEQMNPLTPHYVICRCQSCDGHIEFDASQLVEENSIISCPHCGLETKLYISQNATILAGTNLTTVRREGFFCADPVFEAKAPSPAEVSETPLSNFTEEQINSVGQRQNDAMANRLYGEGDQDMSTKLEDARRYVRENRFKTAAQLLQEKCGPPRDYGQNAAMARGTELEPEARRLYVAKTGREVRPVCLQSTRYNWLRASLDGFAVNNDGVVEIKCGQSAYRTASQIRAVPNYYYGQVQHILAVTGLDLLDFWCYWPGYPPLLIPVQRNDDYIERLVKRESEFWNLVQRR